MKAEIKLEKVVRPVDKVVLELTAEEFNTLFCALGASTDGSIRKIADKYNVTALYGGWSDDLYVSLRDVVKLMKG